MVQKTGTNSGNDDDDEDEDDEDDELVQGPVVTMDEGIREGTTPQACDPNNV